MFGCFGFFLRRHNWKNKGEAYITSVPEVAAGGGSVLQPGSEEAGRQRARFRMLCLQLQLWPSSLCPFPPGSSPTRSSSCRQRAWCRRPRRSQWWRGPAASPPWSTIWSQVVWPWGRCPWTFHPLRPERSWTCVLDRWCTACCQVPARGLKWSRSTTSCRLAVGQRGLCVLAG